MFHVKQLLIALALALATLALAACDDGLDCTNSPTAECRCGGVAEHETCP